ncbi:MAG: hypothetical protein K2H83_01150 [Duncaniella sp.]|nr:hypothetical protein [Duncaniella sp.]
MAQANANGGLDNITVQLIEFKGSGAASPISASGKTQKLPLTLIAGIITALIVAAISLWFIFGAKDGKKSPEKEGIKTEDNRTPGKKTDTTVRKTAPKTEKTVETKEAKEPKKTVKRKKDKANPTDVLKTENGAKLQIDETKGKTDPKTEKTENTETEDLSNQKNLE